MQTEYGREFLRYAKLDHNIDDQQANRYVGDIQSMTQYVIEERDRPFRSIDVFTRLIADRIIFLGYPIDDQIANLIVAQLLFLESSDSNKDILMYINCPGGSVYAGLGIYDTMQYVQPDVATICTGLAASMGAVLQCAGTAGKRTALPHSRVMIHQPMGGAGGQASDVVITAREIQKMKKELYDIIAKHTGQDYDTVWKDSDRDKWFTANEAREYGLVDSVLAARNA